MMRCAVLILLLCSGIQVNAQRFFYTFFGGVAAYRGDLQETPLSFIQAKGAGGIGFMIECNDRMYANMEFNYGLVSADDRFNPLNRARNLNFKSNVAEIAARFEYNLFNLNEVKATPYFFVGIGVFRFGPFYDLSNGGRIYLYEYDTEGQGFYDGREKYKLTQWCLPFGGGIMYGLSKNVRLGLNVGWRYTPTDYLDDVSKTYVDKDLLIRKKGSNAALIAYKGDQLPNGAPYPSGGTARGNPNTKDSYYFLGLTLKVRANPKGRKYVQSKSDKHAGSVECPF